MEHTRDVIENIIEADGDRSSAPSSYHVWVALEAGYPTIMRDSFIIGTGATREVAVAALTRAAARLQAPQGGATITGVYDTMDRRVYEHVTG